MKLIDAEQCPCYKCGATCPYNHPLDDCKKFSCWILATAYDVDKVVEELGEATWQYNPPFNDEPYRMVILSNKAVQIVKRGGINEID